MSSIDEMVRQFHKRFGVPGSNGPGIPSNDAKALRRALIAEEFHELMDELDAETPDLAKISKEGADLVYVIVGMFETFGIPFGQIFAEVHASNMTKTPSEGPAIGKIQKGPDYKPADDKIAKILEVARAVCTD